MAVDTYGLSWFLFCVLNVGIYIAFVMLSYTCVGEDILSHILLIFTLLCSCFYWYCFPVNNKGNVLPEKSNLKPTSSENGAFQFVAVLLSLYSMQKRERSSQFVLLLLIFKYILSLVLLLNFMQSCYQLSVTFSAFCFCSLIWGELFGEYPRGEQLMLC